MSLSSEIILQNKLFAEFMEGQMMLNSVKFRNPPFTHTKKKVFHYEQLEYHSSWEWLMGVVEKIEDLYFVNVASTLDCPAVKIVAGECVVLKHQREPEEIITRFKLIGRGAKFGAVYSACTEFVKWYKIHKLQNGENKNI